MTEVGYDYIGFGAMFPTQSKAISSLAGIELLAKTRKMTSIPIIAIGGISRDNARLVIDAKALFTSVDWQVVFADDKALVFLWDVPANRKVIAKHLLDRRFLQTHLIKFADRLIS